MTANRHREVIAIDHSLQPTGLQPYAFVHDQQIGDHVLQNENTKNENSYGKGDTALPLVRALCQALTVENIVYCHWKSNNALDRSASGDNDLDLLVSRVEAARFSEILYRLGFKHSKAPTEKQMQGVVDYHGYDPAAEKFVHVHVHYQLMLGHDTTKNFRLPIEGPYIESATQSGYFKVPTPEFEYVVFVIRMTLKHSTWDAIFGREGSLKASEGRELAYLQAKISQERVYEILKQHLPFLTSELFDRCAAGLQPRHPLWARVKAAHRMQTLLQTYAQRSLLIDTCTKLWRRLVIALYWRIFKAPTKYSLENGGAIIALLGGDGAGKSTAVDGLYSWLAQNFEITRVHMGKPSWSWVTRVVRTVLKLGQLMQLYPTESSMEETLEQKSLVSPGYPWLIREVCTARDRFLTYLKAQRLAANGGIVIFDRFPHDQIRIMDGPRTEQFLKQLSNDSASEAAALARPHPASYFSQALVKLEKRFYQRIAAPEVMAILLVDPEIAVQRKTEENSDHVRQRSTEIWNVNWKETNVHVIDASKSKSEVLAQLKALVWSRL